MHRLTLLPSVLLAASLIGCDGAPLEFEHSGVRLGATLAQVKALRPDLRPKTTTGSDKLDEGSSGREVFERIEADAKVPYEAYAFVDDRLVLMFLVHAPESSLDEVVGEITQGIGRPNQNVQAGGGRVVGWEAGARELHLIQFPRQQPLKYEDDEGDEVQIQVGFIVWHTDRSDAQAGGALMWLWLFGVVLLGGGTLGSVLVMKRRLAQGATTPSVPLKLTASVTSLACAALFGVGLVNDVLLFEHGLIVLVLLGPALYLNTQLEKQENLQDSILGPQDDAPVAFNG